MHRPSERIPGTASFARFFIPLALQTIGQSVTHPLVAVIAAQAEGGVANVAGMAQATSISFLLQTFNMGLVTTGMIYGKTRRGLQAFSLLNLILISAITGVHLIFALPGPGHVLFGLIIGLPPSIEAPAIVGFRSCIPLAALFMFRARYYAVLFNNKASGRSSAASLFRVALTVAVAPLFVHFGLVGPVWAFVCLTLPVALETYLLARFAAPYIRALPDSPVPPPSVGKLFKFALPLSLGTTLMVASSNILSAFIARAPEPERILPVYALLLGVLNPLTASASNFQRLVLAFAPASLRGASSLRFSLLVGAVLSAILTVFLWPPLANAYFVELQNLSASLLPTLRTTALLMLPLPLMVCVRSQIEGTASYLRRPRSIMLGYAGNVGAILVFGSLGLAFGLSGNLIGAISLIAANTANIAVNLAFLRRTVPHFAVLVPVAARA